MADLPLIPLSNRTVIAIGGDDRISFLQGLVTNDVTNLQGKAVWSALLTAQGKYLHDFIILADGDRLLLDVEAERRDDLIRRLRMFRLRAKVELTDLTGQLCVFARLDTAQAERGTVTEVEGGWQIVDPRHADLGHRFILPVNTPAPGDLADWDRARLTLGIPDSSRDLIPEKSILLDNGFDELAGVAWNKGCYVGQELTARTKYRGLVKKRLLPVRVTGPLPDGGTIVTRDGADVGEIRSGRDDLALALIRLDALPGAVPLLCGGATLSPMPPSWINLPRTEGDMPTNG
ncbi:CAF17-like 4Fe-4S cluster assembly/insertion protein YgfZ [Niveispirillum cyanobacteriorum]|nr:folate-binding protein YgfZ [Niveispirillum cyanobacteriorum]GGE69276.1 glycine cleavage system protein T [Niveispirillum cyanobacteriorum]